jgi:predicted enzyme related to lactoylglutathione lyase
MADPVVHFEIIGRDPEKLRAFFSELFGWEFDTSGQALKEVAESYGFVEAGINGGVGGGQAYEPHVVFYVGVPNVAAALDEAERLGGTRRFGPVTAHDGALVVGQFTDPDGNLIGVAGSE